MENWDEIRTAYHVARHGTVSGAAEALGVHHATVIRHIDALEGRLGVKLFQRHPRGYAATEAGADLLKVAQTTEDQFAQLQNRIKGRGDDVAGELVVTTLSTLSPTIAPVLASFRRTHPEITLRLLTGTRLFRLEYGEAHVAIRAGSPPDQPDNIAQRFIHQDIGLYASKSYMDHYGLPHRVEDFGNHGFVGADGPTGAPFLQWIEDNVPKHNIVFRATDHRIMEDAVRAGIGIGFMPKNRIAEVPDMIEVLPAKKEWGAPLWLVTHVDLHRTGKVQAFLAHMKDHFAA